MKIVKNLICASMFVFALGCSSKPQQSATIEFWTIQLKPVFTDYVNGVIADFEKNHPGVQVKWVDVPFNGVREKLMTAYLAGKPPDVVNLNVEMAISMGGMGALVDMEKALPPEVKSDYLETVWDSSRIDKSVYALPWYLSTSVTNYNKEIFEKAGQKVPSNYEELEAAAKAIREKTGKFAICPKIGSDTDILKYFAMDGAQVFRNGKVTITDPVSLSVMDYWKRMFKNEYIPRAAVIEDHRVALNMFIREQTAILFSGPQFLKIVKENNPSLYGKVGVALPIYGKAGVVDIDVMNIAVTSASKNRQEAVAFAAFVTNGPNQLAFCKQVAILPSVKTALNDPFFSSPGDNIEQEARYIAAKSLLKSKVLISGLTNLTQIQSLLQNATQEIVMDKRPASEAMKDTEDQINRLIAK